MRMPNFENFVLRREVIKMAKVSPVTVMKWEQKKLITPVGSISGVNVYSKQAIVNHLKTHVGKPGPKAKKTTETKTKRKYTKKTAAKFDVESFLKMSEQDKKVIWQALKSNPNFFESETTT